ncbi:MAG: VTT domain-containing protein [Terricaulis sp.]
MKLLTRPAQRNVASIGALAAVCFVATFVPIAFGVQFTAFADGIIRNAQNGHLALPVAIVFFTLASFIGAPQPLLVAACVFASGPGDGFLYSWVATIVAAVADYALGYRARRFAVRSISGFARWRVLNAMKARPFIASVLIRNVPTAPFLVVNMAFGLARASFWRFLGGLVIGVAPKTAVVAFGAKAVMAAISGNVLIAMLAAAACVGIALAGMALSRRFMRRDEGEFADAEQPPAFPSRAAGGID